MICLDRRNNWIFDHSHLLLSFTFLIGCGSVVNNTLKSPGYLKKYSSNMNCVYSVLIPDGMALNISFRDFEVNGSHPCK